MKIFMNLLTTLNNTIIWGIPMIILMLGTGIFLTFVTKGVIFRYFDIVMHYTLFSLFKKQNNQEVKTGAITPFQAVCTALAATVGTGNIVGVAFAIATGGPGAVFWLWLSALIGMVIKYCEVTLSVAYRSTNRYGEIVGGPMYYIENGLKQKWPAVLFASFAAIASFGIGASVQANSFASAVHHFFPVPLRYIGLFTAFLSSLVLIGGIKRIAGLTEVLVPFMAAFYILGAIAILMIQSDRIPTAFAAIFHDAFSGTAATGGFTGASAMYACRIGIARGVFTHEAGMGSAPIAHASADTDHPAKQGLWGAFEVFFDSIVMCTITALVILTSGLWCSNPIMNEGALSSASFEQALKGSGFIVTTGLALFAFATIIAWYYYGEKCVEYLFNNNRTAVHSYRFLYILMIYAGCVVNLTTVWEFADLFNGLMAIPNLIALLLLSPVIRMLSNDFFHNISAIRSQTADRKRTTK